MQLFSLNKLVSISILIAGCTPDSEIHKEVLTPINVSGYFMDYAIMMCNHAPKFMANFYYRDSDVTDERINQPGIQFHCFARGPFNVNLEIRDIDVKPYRIFAGYDVPAYFVDSKFNILGNDIILANMDFVMSVEMIDDVFIDGPRTSVVWWKIGF